MQQFALHAVDAERPGYVMSSSKYGVPAAPARLTAARLGVALGWLGVGIGIAELLAPRAFAQTTGLPARPRVMRAMGVREIVTSAGILLQPNQSGWRWSRVAGDMLDLSLLAWISRGHQDRRLTTMTALVAGLTALDSLAAYDSWHHRVVRRDVRRDTHGVIRIHKSLHIQRPVEACYRFWRNFENFPQFMQHIEAVQVVDATRTHWRVRAPLGQHVEWTAELFSDIPSQQLAWRTLKGSAVEHTGVVRFLPALNDKSTRLDIEMSYHAPFGKAGVMLAKIFGGDPSQQIDDDLRRFKQLIETGEIATTAGQPAGRRNALARLLQRGARS